MTKYIIIAGGEETRWNNYLGVPKHFIKLTDNEPIIERTIRLILSGCERDDKIFVVGRTEQYEIPQTELYVPQPINPNNKDVDKFINSRDLWNDEGRTVLILGDVWFSNHAMETIIGYEKINWVFFGRRERSLYTGKFCRELFAVSFYPKNHEYLYAGLMLLANKNYEEDNCFHQIAGGWSLYNLLNNQNIYEHNVRWNTETEFPSPNNAPIIPEYKHFVNIDDFTDDFDFPCDYDNWIERWNNR